MTDQRPTQHGIGAARRARSLLRRGFTLIEVMVAITIASFTVSALYGLFTVQSRQFIMQDMQMEMHQNLRFAADMLSRSVRMAGYGTGGTVTGVMGISTSSDELPVVVSWDAEGPSGTDAITVVYADPSLVMDTSNTVLEQCDTESITFRPGRLNNQESLEQLEAGDLLICFDYADVSGMETYMWTISEDPDLSSGEVFVEANSNYSDYDSVCATSENLTPVMTCSKARVLTFYIDDDDDGTGPGSAGHPVLMMDFNMDWPASDDVPLVDNIEDLQLEYCVDDGTDSVDCSDESNWVDEVDTDDAAFVWMVRISLLARSPRAELRNKYIGIRPALGNHDAASSSESDHYYRQVMSTEVTIRNNRLQATL